MNDVVFYQRELDAARWFFSQRQNKETYRMVDHARPRRKFGAKLGRSQRAAGRRLSCPRDGPAKGRRWTTGPPNGDCRPGSGMWPDGFRVPHSAATGT